jgi:glutaredoxin
MKLITLFTKKNCPYCDSAKALLDSKKIGYEVIDITENTDAKEFVVSRGHTTVPQLYVGEEILVHGGYIGLYKMTTEEILEKLQ